MPTAPPPPENVLQAFNLSSIAEPLTGGQGESFVVGNVVLKPATDPIESEWVSSLQGKLVRRGNPAYRMAEPVAVTDSDPPRYVVDGWMAMKFIPGQPSPLIHYDEVLPASRAMHAELVELVDEPPEWLDSRAHRWAWAEWVAWEEVPLDQVPELNVEILKSVGPWLDRLVKLRKPLDPASVHRQIVHGDLSGNILYGPDPMKPTIIDFTPVWRPVEYAEAILLSDGITFRSDGEEEVRRVGLTDFRLQMLVRALYFRVVTYVIQVDPAFVQIHLPKMDVEKAVRLLERLCKSEGVEKVFS